MLDDAIDAYLKSVTERAFDEPLLALLRTEGYSDVHRTHGGVEFGKDFIAKRNGVQWAFQSKAGNIAQADWRDLTGQLDELRLSDLSHPSFDTSLPRQCVLVCTGRLTGNAPLSAQEYNARCREREEPTVEFWGRDVLLPKLLDAPAAVLRGSEPGLLSMLGLVESGELSIDLIEQFSRRWTGWKHTELASLGVIELSLIAQALANVERLDLASHMALTLVRAAWAVRGSPQAAAEVADAAGALFEAYALPLFERNRATLADAEHGPLVQPPFDWVTYPVRAIRTAELLGLLTLRLRERDSEGAAAVAELLSDLAANHPGCAHPLGDRYAVSLIPAVLALHGSRPDAATKLLHQTTAWLGERYQEGLGLADVAASPDEEVVRVFGPPFSPTLPRRAESYLACVLLDLAAVLGLKESYNDIINDILAVGAVPYLVEVEDVPAQYLRYGTGAVRVFASYAEEWPSDGRVAAHHAFTEADFELGRQARWWDQLAVQAVLRDRQRIPALRAFVV